MKLIKARTRYFRSIEDSNEFEIGNLTCLVGKNEAGKTAILQSLYGLKPFKNFEYDKTRDYPRRFLSKFEQNNPDGESEVIKTWWELEDEDLQLINEKYMEGVLAKNEITISFGIGYSGKTWNVELNESQYVDQLLDRHKLNAAEQAQLKDARTTQKLAVLIDGLETKTDKQNAIRTEISSLRKDRLTLAVIDTLNEILPSMFYTSHYNRMAGEISLNKLASDKGAGTLSPEDEIFLDFLEYAGTNIDELQKSSKYEDLKAQCEGASNDITDEIFEFWSQNEALSVQIDLGEGRSEDPAPFNSGTVAKIRIYNQNHRASVPLSERSAGFVWFFSFLSQFKQLQNTAGNAIILLDEPGLTLHGKAQSDLLRYIQERLLPEHQVIYTTHSPFMVPADKLEDVRVVEDVVEYDKRKVTVHGTKVSSDVLSVDQDTLFPLQGHLGYEITQSLFIGRNTLLVEGPSDILYLQALSSALKDRAREGLDPSWTICPTGGIDKVHSFASLFGGNHLNIAVLCDLAHGDKKKVERLRQSQILNSSQVFTMADFTSKSESDVEDIFHPKIYSEILNQTYSLSKDNKLSSTKLAGTTPKTERLVKQAENAFKLFPSDIPEFDHFTPASWLIKNLEILGSDSSEVLHCLDIAESIFKTLNGLLD
jgi:predicted ATP-dependent endonuclease of OLD family